MGEGCRVVKRMPSGYRERLRQKPDSRDQAKASGLHRLLAMPEGGPFKEIFAQPRL